MSGRERRLPASATHRRSQSIGLARGVSVFLWVLCRLQAAVTKLLWGQWTGLWWGSAAPPSAGASKADRMPPRPGDPLTPPLRVYLEWKSLARDSVL